VKRRERAIRLLPPPVKRVAKDVRTSIDPLYVALYRRRSGYGGLIPPGELRARTGWPNVDSFVEGGEGTASQLESALEKVGRSFADFDSVLDFGSGCGRVLPRVVLRGKEGARFHGSDVDAEAIAWAAELRPEAGWSVNGAEPPLPFPDETFDLLYSVSILTHLDEELQCRWLDDFARVLRPGGYALLTTHGEEEFEAYRSGRQVSNTPSCARRVALHGSLREERFIHEPYVQSKWTSKDFPGTDSTFGLAFQSEDYVRDVWAKRFEILDIVPRAVASRQDVVVARKRVAEHER
jgi:SAM-dependent methyltransferase